MPNFASPVSFMADPSLGFPLFSFDVVTSEVHEATCDPTEFPVETGADISDHIRSKPAQVTIVGHITMTPMSGGVFGPMALNAPFYDNPISSLSSAISAAGDAIKNAVLGPPGPLVIQVMQFPIPLDPITDSHTLLKAIKDSRLLCVVTTSTLTYSDVALISLTMNKSELGIAEFTCVFREIITVTSQTVVAPIPLVLTGLPKKSAGTTTPTPSPAQLKDTALLAAGKFVAQALP